MAEVARDHSIPSGHDEDYVYPPDEDFQCIICQLPSKEPVQTSCGHRFCKQCLEEYFRRQELEGGPLTCPTDRQVLERNKDIFPDRATERKILSLVIRCPSDGCEWTGELRAKKNHFASCQWKAVSCTNQNCEVKVVRKDLTEHVTTTCKWRIVNCNYCKEQQPRCQMEDHLQMCSGYLIACPNNCGTRISQEMIANHLESNCPQTEVPCPYVWIGCNSEIQRKDLETHLQCETRHHLDLACRKLKDSQDEVTKKMTKLEKQLDEKASISIFQNQLEDRVNLLQNQREDRVNVLQNQLAERVDTLQTEINAKVDTNHKTVEKELNTYRNLFFCFVVVSVVGVFLYQTNIIQNQQERLVILEWKVKSYRKTLEEKVVVVQSQLEKKVEKVQSNLETEVNDVQSKMEKKVDNVKKDMDSLDAELSYKIMLLNAAEPHTFTWKITRFENILTQAKKTFIESEPFHIYGYKLKLRLKPNGKEEGENTHLSLFIIVMKGEHDAILAWPFHKKVEFTLIDQQENPHNRENITMAFLADPHLENFARPVKDENVGRGFSTFASHDKLKERRFIVDDTIFIQVKVSPPR